MSFIKLGLSKKTVKALNEIGFEEPTTVQIDVIPAILEGKDIFTIAPNCCGKTISYLLPLVDIINKKNPQNILIITSDSDKSVEVSDYLATLNKFHEEETHVESEESDVIIGSPNLLVELLKEEQIDLSNINILVVDDINLIKSTKQISAMEQVLELLPANKQNIVYTTRRSKETQIILDKILKTPQEVKVDKKQIIESPQKIDVERFLALSQNPNIDKNQILVPKEIKNAKKLEKEKRKNKEEITTKKDISKNHNSDVNTDSEALKLVEKYNSFNGRTPSFMLKPVTLSNIDSE